MSYDRYLQTGPYNFGCPASPDKVEHFPYQNGLLVSYWDTSFSDNNESQHPGQGEILPIDANPRPIYEPRRHAVARPDPDLRRAVRAGEVGLVHAARAVGRRRATSAARPRMPVFDDRREYWDPALPNVGVKVPHVGVRIRVLQQNGTSMRVRVSSANTGT